MTDAFKIPFVGLKLGQHEFEFDVDDSFFETLSYSLIEKGKLKVWLDLEKKETMLLASFQVDGTVEMVCSRCNESMDAELEGELDVIYKFGNESIDDENLGNILGFRPLYKLGNQQMITTFKNNNKIRMIITIYYRNLYVSMIQYKKVR